MYIHAVNGIEFIRRVRRYAKKTDQTCYFDPSRGKGSHGLLYVGHRRTVVKQGELSKGILTAMLKQLGIEKRDF